MPNPNPATVSNTIGAFKEMYTGDMVKRLAYENHAFLDLVPKETNFGGKYLPIVVISGGVGSRSGTFATALVNQFPTTVREFLLTRVKDYSIMGLDREAMLASAVDGGAFFKLKTEELEAQIYRLSRSLALALFRDGTGNLGQLNAAAVVASTSILLSDPNDARHFEANDVIQLSVAANGNPFRSGGATAQITGVNVDGGILTFASNLSAQIAAATAGDFIFIQGDNPGNLPATNVGILKVAGLAGWIPQTRPTAGDAWFGVDRSIDTTRYAGTFFDARGFTIKEGLLKTLAQVGAVGGHPDYAFISFQNWADLADSIDTRHVYVDPVKGESGFAYDGLVMNSPQGKIRILADNGVPENISYLIQMNTAKFYSLGDAPELITEDIAGGLLRDPGSDSFQVRMSYMGNFGFNAPGWNGAALIK